jgi:hypothetical protein
MSHEEKLLLATFSYLNACHEFNHTPDRVHQRLLRVGFFQLFQKPATVTLAGQPARPWVSHT